MVRFLTYLKANVYYKLFISWTNQKIKETFVKRNMFDFNHIKVSNKLILIILVGFHILHWNYRIFIIFYVDYGLFTLECLF